MTTHPTASAAPAGNELDLVAEQLIASNGGPSSIDDVLRAAFALPTEVYALSIQAAAERLCRRPTPPAVKPAIPGRVWADGWRQQLPGSWPYYPDEPHYCHRVGHWTRDGAQLVLACCGIDAT